MPAPWELRRLPRRKVGFCAEEEGEEEEERMKAPTPTRTWGVVMGWEWEGLVFGGWLNDWRFDCALGRMQDGDSVRAAALIGA